MYIGLQKMEGMFPDLRDLHKKLLQAASLHEDLHAYAALLAPCLPGEPSKVSDEAASEPLPGVSNVSTSWNPRDVTLLKLSLIQILVIKADNVCIEAEIRCQYTRVLELLLQNEVDASVIELLNTSDRMLSHISSKCLSYLVLFQLRYQNEVNAHWLQFCNKSLCLDPGSPILLPCLTSLLAVYKEILTDERLQKADLLLSISMPLETVFERFCSTIFTCLSNPSCPSLAQASEHSSQLSCLLDLLEVLVALRIMVPLSISLWKPVLLAILPQALNMISSPVPYFVKKQIILVLKRCLLYKAGENFLPSSLTISHQQDPVLDEDMGVLAGTLLGAVQQGWLLQVPVSDRSSSFGGLNVGSERGPDRVVLGALSLSVLKAMEIYRHGGSLDGGKPGSAVLDLGALMTQLLEFLKPHIAWKDPEHPCEWLSLIFIEQDDDMLEVANCLLKMYHHNPSLCFGSTSSESEMWTQCGPSHQCGINPHCIFLYLLSSVSFDSSVLLDFLISSETCFLEYLVRYLKLLKSDCPQFCLICTLFDKSSICDAPASESDSVRTLQEPPVKIRKVLSECTSLPTSLSSTTIETGTSTSSPVHHTKHSTPSSPSGFAHSSLGTLQRLVDYDSSEDSESEVADSECHSVTVHSTGADNTDIDNPMRKLELKGQHPIQHGSQPSSAEGSNALHAQGIQQRAVQCLEDLREAITRLHKKKLFPYNPSALLRLLSHISNPNTE
ncbi:protein Lines homolog 1 [Hyperolius riggenbachi]|uniref:protein Lines homolog 1 n=1 Tax=Hyperolius riggenbachi TaxID=752182 RepID=UPI0035A381E0